MNKTNARNRSTSKRAPQGIKSSEAKPQRLKLGIDVHQSQYTVVAQIDGASPRPARRFSPEGFIVWVSRQLPQVAQAHSCYEAGAFGYGLHRRLVALGVHNVVVRPRNWDEYARKVKTDNRDALALCAMLDRHLAGNTEALCVIRVPSEAEEQARGLTRQRGSLVVDRTRLINRAKGTARYFGYNLPQRWWRPRAFARLAEQVPEHLYQALARWQAVLLVLDEQIDAVTGLIEAARPVELPTGLGALTAECLDREVGQWERFKNRRQVGSYTGLIPAECSSGTGRKQGAVTKHGNPRVRHLLIEAVWRMTHSQPDYRAIRKHAPALAEAKRRGHSARRRKLIVAIAREFAVDWWRLSTARTTPEALGLQMSWPAAAVLRSKRPAKSAAQAA
jgi:transposase